MASCEMEFCGNCPFVVCPYEDNSYLYEEDDAEEFEKNFEEGMSCDWFDMPDV